MLASSFSTRFLLRKNRRSRLPAPLGPLFCRPRHGSAAPGPQRQNPGPPRFQLGFCCAKIGAAGYRPHLLGLPRKSGRGISLRETTLCGCPLRGHGFATPHRYFAVPVTAPPRRAPNGKTPALAPIRSHFACGETAQPVVAPAGGNVLATPFSLRSNVAPHIPAGSAGVRSFVPRLAPRSHPGACSRSVAFRSAKPRWPVTGPTFWVCRAKAGAAFRCAKPPCAVVRFAAMASPPRTAVLPSPSRLRRARPPTAKPRRLLPFGRISPAAKPRGRSLPPPGPMCWPAPLSLCSSAVPRPKPRRLPPFGRISLRETALAGHRPHRGRCFGLPRFRFAQAWSPGQNPGAPRFQSGFCCAKTGGRGRPLSDGRALTKSENIIFCASFCHPLRSPYPHCTLPRVRFSGIGQKKKPQRKTAAAVAYHSLFLSFRLCGTRAPACFVIRIHSPSVSSRRENKKGKRARFPFWLCSERLISARSAFSLFFAALVPDIARLIRTHTSLFGTTLPPPPAPSRSAFQ